MIFGPMTIENSKYIVNRTNKTHFPSETKNKFLVLGSPKTTIWNGELYCSIVNWLTDWVNENQVCLTNTKVSKSRDKWKDDEVVLKFRTFYKNSMWRTHNTSINVALQYFTVVLMQNFFMMRLFLVVFTPEIQSTWKINLFNIVL